MTVTDPIHVAAAASLRYDYQHPAARTEGGGLIRDLTRDLADYDQAFGIDPDQLAPTVPVTR